MNNFDSIAPYYDRLSRLVFGKAMRRSQTAFLPEIAQGANVLILGGGTGWLLQELYAVNPSCKIWYIDASARMIEFSKKIRNPAQQVVFIQGTENSIPASIPFDAVITNFYLDLFPQQTCMEVIRKIRSVISAHGIWLITDFVDTTWWHGAMLRIMYRFFKLVSAIEGNALPEWKGLMHQNEFAESKSQEFFGGFIKSALFRLEK